MKKYWRMVVSALLCSICIELFYFNLPYFMSLTEKPKAVQFSVDEGLVCNDDGTYTVVDKSKAILKLEGIHDDTGYIQMDISYRKKEEAETTYVKVSMTATDEGHAVPYLIGSADIWESFPKTTYIRPNFYGNAIDLSFTFNAQNNSILEVHSITLHANVPLFVNVLRLFIMTAAFAGILCLVKKGKFSTEKLGEKKAKQIAIVAGVLIVNALVLWFVVNMDEHYREPNSEWIPFTQYKLLAESLADGRVNIEPWNKWEYIDKLSSLSNPYDCNLRKQQTGIGTPDFAFYNNELYVYFGIVPALIYYLPYYLLTGSHINTWITIYLSAVAVMVGACYLLYNLIRRYFPNTPFFLFILLSVLLGNGTGIITILLIPYFYSLPIITALAFTYWGLGFWVNASARLLQKRKRAGSMVLAGSLCMALVAGCRPQFLLGSFFVFPIFAEVLRSSEKKLCARNVKTLVIGIAPYLIVAAGLMYYNYIRFDSPFDFGANYNVTSNDMTKRGFNIGRLSDGIYMYLYQLPVITNVFPFVRGTNRTFTYLGETISEQMFGGVFFTHLFTMFSVLLYRVKKQMKKKGLLTFAGMCICFAVFIVIADTEMAGILSRYYNDFLWLLMLVAILVFLQLWENANTFVQKKRLFTLLCVGIISALGMDFAVGLYAGGFQQNNSLANFCLQNLFT